MSHKKITQLVVESILNRPKGGDRAETWDTQLPGFGIRGHSSILHYRMPGAPKARRWTIGKLALNLDPAKVRERARDALRDVERGIDPAAQKKAAKQGPGCAALPEPNTVAAVAARFVKLYHEPKNKSWKETERTLRNHVIAGWGADRSLATVSKADAFALIDGLTEKGQPIAARRVYAAASKMCSWAVERDIIPVSPFKDISAPGEENERDVVLSDDHLARLWRAAEQIGGTAGGFVRMLALSAQRRTEVASMKWADVDLEQGIWTLPKEATKANRSHRVPLSTAAVEVLRGMEPRVGEYIFTTDGESCISGFSKIKARIQKIAGIEIDWRFHDLRRTAATGMGDLGISGSVISKILNHREGGVTRIYNRSDQMDARRSALEGWAQHVVGLVHPRPSNVTGLTEHRARIAG